MLFGTLERTRRACVPQLKQAMTAFSTAQGGEQRFSDARLK
jgi:hypothetical protein